MKHLSNLYLKNLHKDLNSSGERILNKLNVNKLII